MNTGNRLEQQLESFGATLRSRPSLTDRVMREVRQPAPTRSNGDADAGKLLRGASLNWLSRRQDENAANPPGTGRSRRYRMLITLTVAGAFAFGVCNLFLFDNSVHRRAFADSIPGVDGVQTITWTRTVYEEHSNKDGSRKWRTKRVVSKNEYRHPGQHRETWLDKSGEIDRIEIRDDKTGKQLVLTPRNRTADLTMVPVSSKPESPFAFVGEGIRTRTAHKQAVKSVSLGAPRMQDGKQTNVVRLVLDAGPNWTPHDIQAMFDAETKSLFAVIAQQSKSPIADLDAAVANSGPADSQEYQFTILGSKDHELVINTPIDASHFSMEAPTGYKVNTVQPTVTEEQVLAFLKAVSKMNQDAFPDHTGWWAMGKSEEEMTPAEKEYDQLRFKFFEKKIHTAPVHLFEQQQAKPDTFCYVGAGIKLGDADRIICWYQPVGQSKYRVIYGDLSVKEAAESELPLNFKN